MTRHLTLSRRSVLIGTGALVLSFSSRNLLAQTADTPPVQPAAPPPPKRPGSLDDAPFLDSWIRVDANGAITVFTGKAELGQGIQTAILQVAAEELEVPFESLKLVTADTAQTPNEGYTAGSQSMQESATAVRNAAAQVRELLIAEAAKRANAQADQFRAENGAVLGPDNRRFTYGELVSDTMLHVEALPESKLKTDGFKVMGKSIPRIDIPARVTGGEIYVQDLRPEGMVHARVVRPPSYGATLSKVDTAAAESMPGVVKVVRDGSFLAVAAEREFQAIKAMRALAETAEWQEKPSLPDETRLPAAVTALAAQTETIHNKGGPVTGAKTTLEATYTRPYIMHGSIGPSCAVARADPGGMTIWSHTQGVYPDRAAIAEMLGMPPEQVHLIHVSGSGCYGHNGADDAAADAALIARAVPGRPVRVQWMREQENGWEPYGPAMVSKAKGSLDGDGRIVDWEYSVWSNTHSTRPGTAGSLIAARHLARALHAAPAQEDPAALGRRQPQFGAALRHPECARDREFPARNAGPRLGLARARRSYERVCRRKLHGRAGGCGRRRSGGIPAEASGGPAGARRDRQGGRALRLAVRRQGRAGPRLWLRLCALQESRRLLRRRGGGRGLAGNRPVARGACGGGGRCRPDRQPRRPHKSDRRRDPAVGELDAL